MAKIITNRGKNVAVFPRDDICVIFREITKNGYTEAAKPEKGPEPPPRRKIWQFYKIRTTAEHKPPVEIRIILPRTPPMHRARLLRWYPKAKEWKDITESFSSKYHFIKGITRDCLESIFGVTK